MNANDAYFMELLQTGRIRVDTETGIVYSLLATGKPKPVGAKQSAGYLQMSAGPSRQERHYILLHRLVWLAVHGSIPDGQQINHKNGDKRDNRIENLEVVTRGENAIHAHVVLGKVFGLFGRDNAGENSTNAKLTWEQVRTIRRLHATGLHTQAALAVRFGVRHTQISNIVNYRCWRE